MMLRRGPGVVVPNTTAPSSPWTIQEPAANQQQQQPQQQQQQQQQQQTGDCVSSDREEPPIRGLLKLLRGQIPGAYLGGESTNSETAAVVVSHYRYHGPTLRESQKELQKKKRGRKRNQNKYHEESGDLGSLLEYSKHTTPFGSAVGRHKFVAFFVVQGITNSRGRACYSAHTLKLRDILATDYHGVVTTFVLDIGSSAGSGCLGNNGLGSGLGNNDEETGGTNTNTDHEPSGPFCRGTGFCLFPTTPFSSSTTLALLQVTKSPSVVVLDARSGRIVERDAILAMERNDSHTVVNRWQCGNNGLTIAQQMGAVATCDCAHGPCCGGGSGGCCVVQ